MSVGQHVVNVLSVLLRLVLLAILVHRGHHRRLPIFTLYLAVTSASSVALGLHYTLPVWLLQQVILAAFRIGFTLELAYRIFGAFPAAAATARRVMLVILVFTAVTALSIATPDATYMRLHAEAIPRVSSAVVWTLTALAVLVLWYRLPLAPLPRAILMGYALYLLISSIGLSLLFHDQARPYRVTIAYVTAFAYLVLGVFWARVAWVTPADAPVAYRAAVPVPRPAV